MELEPITWDMMHSLPPDEREEPLKVRREWLERARYQDRLNLNNINARIWHKKHWLKRYLGGVNLFKIDDKSYFFLRNEIDFDGLGISEVFRVQYK